jgi:cysteinyl-tRNA synthetase
MKTPFLSMICLFFLMVSCNQQKESTVPVTVTVPTKKITESDISKLKFLEYGLDTKTEKEIQSWEKYKELEDITAKLKKGDLTFFKDNSEAIKTFLKDFKEKIPDTLNTPSVAARIIALETKLYKLESASNLSTTTKEELRVTIKEFLESLSNLNLQMNKKLEKDSQDIQTP